LEISFEKVFEIWAANAGKPTEGVLSWFRPPCVNKWSLTEIQAIEVGYFRFIGEEFGGPRGAMTMGTYKVADATSQDLGIQGFRWDPSWHIVAVMDPENKQLVILDGNERALQLSLAIKRGAISPNEKVKLVIGELNVLVVRIAKAVCSLWR
jgi:hypothetical protein